MMLSGKVAIVSGVGPGLGLAVALALARHGASLVLGARTAERLEEVAGAVADLGADVVWGTCDVTSDADCQALVARARAELGGVDILVNNAFLQPPLEPLEDVEMDTWRQAFEVNLLGTVRMTTAAAPVMRERGGGSVVCIGSMSARRIRRNFGVYAATKSALITTAQTFARELGPDGIRVNTVLPGYIWGPSLQWWFGHLAQQQGRTRDEVYDEVAAETALHHLPTPDEIAEAVVFFASPMSRVVTGQTLDVNAGHWFG
jgi:NAD(P)-dependent dehydrogenase (short-subunit alcohol dehydrogenase family)